MAALTVQEITRAGVVPTYAAADSEGDTFTDASRGARCMVHVKNGGGAPINVTIDSTRTFAANSGAAAADLVIAVANGAERMIGPFGPDFSTSAGLVTISYSAVTSVTVAAIRLP